MAGAGVILWVDKGCWLMIFSIKLNICITGFGTMDYNWLGIGIRIGFRASSSMNYIREQYISSTSNKFNQCLQVSTYTNKDLSWARVLISLSTSKTVGSSSRAFFCCSSMSLRDLFLLACREISLSTSSSSLNPKAGGRGGFEDCCCCFFFCYDGSLRFNPYPILLIAISLTSRM